MIIVIHLAGVCVYAITDDEIVDMKQQIVDADLIENSLCDLNIWRLVFDYHFRVILPVVKDAVGTDFLLTDLKRNLIRKQSSGEILVFNQIVDEVLADPFFGS